MKLPFPEPILNLPQADVALPGLTSFISQGENHQILFMHFSQDIALDEHFHQAQWGIVLEGRITMQIDGESKTYEKGDRFFFRLVSNILLRFMQATRTSPTSMSQTDTQ